MTLEQAAEVVRDLDVIGMCCAVLTVLAIIRFISWVAGH